MNKDFQVEENFERGMKFVSLSVRDDCSIILKC